MDIFDGSLIAAAWLVGGVLNSLCGIGAALVALPCVTFVLPVQETVIHGNLVGLVACLCQWYLFRAYRTERLTTVLTLASVPGICLGVLLLHLMPGGGLLALIGIILLCYLLVSCLRPRGVPERGGRRMLVGAGFFSGVMQGVASMGGPPVSVYAMREGWSPQVIMGTLAAYFVNLILLTGGVHFLSGMMSLQVLVSACYGSVGSVVGLYVGSRLLRLVDVVFCRRLLFVIIAYCAASCMWRGLRQLLS